jgi:ABC-type nickel/cobalt efflux system permease component RcnA
MNFSLAEAVRRSGFRKWYERQLLSSHAHMVLAFLSVIALVASMEAFRTAEGDQQALNVMYVLVCAGIGAWALRRYLFLLMRAEYTANQANCPECGTYARFGLVRQRAAAHEIDVRCQKCSREWLISAGK